METKRKTDLFRFATVRAPQLISKERRALGFIENKRIEQSEFFSSLNLNASLDVLRSGVQNRIGSFAPYKSVEEVKSLHPDFWDFSLWLAENRNELVRDELDDRVTGLSLMNGFREKLWDQIYFDILTETNPYVRQACIQMLVADNFITNYRFYSPNDANSDKTAEAKLLKRLANGKVVIHPAITRKKVTALPGSRTNHLPSFKQEEKLKAQIAGLHADSRRRIEAELKDWKIQYTADYKTAYDLKLSQYQATVKPIIAQFLANNPAIKNDENREAAIPDDVIEPFDFKFSAPLAFSYTNGQLSQETAMYIKSRRLQDEDIDTVLNQISAEKDTFKRQAANTLQKQIKEVVINGVKVKANLEDSKEFALFLEETDSPNEYSVYFSMDAGFKGAHFTDANFTLRTNTGIGSSITNPCLKETKDSSVFVKFPDPIILDPCNTFTFTADLTLSNGQIYSMQKSAHSNQRMISGRLFRINNEPGEIHLYGVNRIGVIDYRKVEQELCCYVPGEVSHIENIMAKEYKDRSTRSLLRVEQSTELSSEQEVETNTDTTSTTRDELSSEVSKIIDKERNTDLGFNAQASGGSENTYKWNVGGSADFSFGQSTSNSNSIARTKAQELTQRAVERVVQKISSVRTSKMLREFEDSSTHGFDNRKGSSHITGVYRWVDKVYKNRIVNYGKRLVYEFMIPEPARWYKEAIIIEKEESDATVTPGKSGPILEPPVHPKEKGIINSESITREDYSKFASFYGADIIAPMDRYKSVTDSYAESVGDNKEHSYNNYTPVTFPDGYVCTQISGSYSGYYKSTSSPYAYLKIGAGGKTHVHNFGDGKGNYNGTFTHSGLNCTPSAKITISTRKVDTVNLSVAFKCELAAERFQQWQQDAYASIMEAYNRQLTAFNDAQAAEKAEAAAKEAEAKEGNESVSSNSMFNAQIINTELKRLCIEMLTTPFNRPQGKDLYLTGDCKVPKIALSSDLDEYASQVKFFEQAFDWSILSEMFYPYYWAKKCDWKELFQSQDGNDMSFQAFLQSGMARIMVPVREGFEDAVVFYMETGKIWNGTGLVVDTDDELYLSIVDEMTEIKGFTEGDEWEIVVPSDLTIIQAKSAFLEDEGLPCCHDNVNVPVHMKFQGTDKVLTAKDETEEPTEPVDPSEPPVTE